MKIYTKTGDQGYTSLFGGARLSKDNIRIEAYGTVDELNSFTGVLYDAIIDQSTKQTLKSIQNLLFNLGSVLATDPESEFQLPGIEEDDITLLEGEIDRMEARLEPLKNFILPSGHPSVSAAHVCRTVCRRAERRVVTLDGMEKMDAANIQFLNRLSDYFFVVARYLAHTMDIPDTLWNQKEK